MLFFLLSCAGSSSSTAILKLIQDSLKHCLLFYSHSSLWWASSLTLPYWLHPLLWLFGLSRVPSSLWGKSLIFCMFFGGSAYQNIGVEGQFFLCLISEELRVWAHVFISASRILFLRLQHSREWAATRGHMEVSFIHVSAAVDGPELLERFFWPLHWKQQLLSP